MRIWVCALALTVTAVTAGARQTGEIVLGMSAAFTGPSGQLGADLYRGPRPPSWS